MNRDPLSTLILGQSGAIQRVRALVEKLAPTRVPVLIQGPTGAGKELVAQALHATSGRSGSLVAVNLSAVNEGLFESLMFGHMRGSFTGALGDTLGFLGEAKGGTLFLDELSAFPPTLQPKLLRTLETKLVRRLGGRVDTAVDFRIVSATNIALGILISKGLLRSDLAHRLAAIVIEVPALAERRGDITFLANHFARQALDAPFGPAVLERRATALLETYHWPGNVRQLRNVIESAVILADSANLTVRDIARQLERSAEQHVSRSPSSEREKLENALAIHGNSVTKAARQLRIHRVTVWRRMRRFGLMHDDYLTQNRAHGASATFPPAANGCTPLREVADDVALRDVPNVDTGENSLQDL